MLRRVRRGLRVRMETMFGRIDRSGHGSVESGTLRFFRLRQPTLFLDAAMRALLLLLSACSGLPALEAVPEAPPHTPGLAAPLPDGVFRLEAQLEPIRAEEGVPALGAVIVDSAGIQAVGVVGTLHTGEDAGPITDASPWHLGSNGKSITALVIARLAERGVLSFDTRVGDHLADLPIHSDWHPVTLDQLLRHSGGVPANTGMVQAFRLQREPYASQPRAARRAILSATLKDPPQTEPGSTFQYSNLGYALAGAVAEAATDTPWETLVVQEVLEPLALHSAGFGPPVGDAAPWGHNFIGGVPAGPTADNPPAISPAGTMHMALVDQARLTQLHLTKGASVPGYLTEASWTQLHEPGPHDYAMGWNIQERNWSGGPFWTHDGSNTMWYARSLFAPGIDRGLMVVTNHGPPSGSDAVRAAETLLRTLPLDRD